MLGDDVRVAVSELVALGRPCHNRQDFFNGPLDPPPGVEWRAVAAFDLLIGIPLESWATEE